MFPYVLQENKTDGTAQNTAGMGDDDDDDDDDEAEDMEAFEESGMLEEEDTVTFLYFYNTCTLL